MNICYNGIELAIVTYNIVKICIYFVYYLPAPHFRFVVPVRFGIFEHFCASLDALGVLLCPILTLGQIHTEFAQQDTESLIIEFVRNVKSFQNFDRMV